MNPNAGRGRPGALLYAWLRACTVPDAHAGSPLAPAPDAALAALRVDGTAHLTSAPSERAAATDRA
ncbi:hypothetical protein ACH4VR_10710 [Streptomyces sp. NPDC020883]|uniref:hypothetical protein n=1 Tax=unclassified Streptomyces TaxID=2593676 RepID=UPI0034E1BF8D